MLQISLSLWDQHFHSYSISYLPSHSDAINWDIINLLMRSFDMKQKYFVMMLMGYLIPNLAFSADDLKSSSLLNQNPQNSNTQNTTTHAQQEVTIIDTNGNLKAVQKSVSTPIPSPSKVNPPPSQTQSAETSKNGKNVLPSSPNDSTAMQVPPDSSV